MKKVIIYLVCVLSLCVYAGLPNINISKKTTFTLTYNDITLSQAAEIEQRIRKYLSDANDLKVCFGESVTVANYSDHENSLPWWWNAGEYIETINHDIVMGGGVVTTQCLGSLGDPMYSASDSIFSEYDIPVGWGPAPME